MALFRIGCFLFTILTIESPRAFLSQRYGFESIDFITDFFVLRWQGMVDISESRGYSFFKDKEINIDHETIRYLEELMYDSIKNITKV